MVSSARMEGVMGVIVACVGVADGGVVEEESSAGLGRGLRREFSY